MMSDSRVAPLNAKRKDLIPDPPHETVEKELCYNANK
jgi:hypothetical protein